MLKKILMCFTVMYGSLSYAAPPKIVAPITSSSNQRIVVLEFSLLDNLNQLGLKPVGVGTSGFLYEGSDPEYLQSIIANTPSVGAREAPNLEAIARLKPDLIIADLDFNQNLKPQLDKIAPTILLKGIFGLPEQQMSNLKTIAKLTNTNAQTDSIIADYNKVYAQAQNNAQKGGRTKILIGFPTSNNSFNALANNSITSQILARLGKQNLITQNTSSQLFELSMEGLINKNPDQIVILISNNELSAYHNLQKSPLWQHLSAVKNNKVYLADRNIWGKSHGLEALELMYREGIQSGFLENTRSTNAKV